MRYLARGFSADTVRRARYNRYIHVGLPADTMDDYAAETSLLEQDI
ncbi:hypothetical protein OHAE_2788 [Ochrobactrum soli]|uniref:Uncharacterized protein n=1 Tax=Ochrobactrum soli TaxID=2448455 RepID=A0A2P9HFH8_9HYPH|nr:hypothetical protein OHAE_2788 [[Ochrobactrum] soli]